MKRFISVNKETNLPDAWFQGVKSQQIIIVTNM